ncbi:MAG: ketoacyl-ACP synthase III [Saprospiraceae bacterium]|nr:ketoacyl-ACP synthase III [Saprospiraceae bacterium]
MARTSAKIAGIQGYVPEYVLTNAELEQMVETSDEWITSRTGIQERRILKEDGKATSDMAAEAVKGLLAKTNIKPEDIDLTICGTVTPDTVFPDTANTINSKIGASNAWGFDINAACSGFLYALSTGARFVESGKYKKVLVIGVDMMSSIVDYQDRATCILFGDGAGAVLLEPSDNGFGIVDEIMRGDGQGRDYLIMKAGGSLNPPSAETVARREHFVHQEGKPVFKAAVKGMTDAVRLIMERNDITNDDVSWLVPHQANKRIISSVSNALDFPLAKVMMNIERYGNTTAATIPLCLWEWESKLQPGDKIILTAFGGGFTWGAIYLEWSYDGALVVNS